MAPAQTSRLGFLLELAPRLSARGPCRGLRCAVHDTRVRPAIAVRLRAGQTACRIGISRPARLVAVTGRASLLVFGPPNRAFTHRERGLREKAGRPVTVTVNGV